MEEIMKKRLFKFIFCSIFALNAGFAVAGNEDVEPKIKLTDPEILLEQPDKVDSKVLITDHDVLDLNYIVDAPLPKVSSVKIPFLNEDYIEDVLVLEDPGEIKLDAYANQRKKKPSFFSRTSVRVTALVVFAAISTKFIWGYFSRK